jgi:hypothetical protein
VASLITDPELEAQLKEERRARGADHHDEVFSSQVLPLQFQLIAGDPRPQIRVVHPESGRQWLV